MRLTIVGIFKRIEVPDVTYVETRPGELLYFEVQKPFSSTEIGSIVGVGGTIRSADAAETPFLSFTVRQQ